MLTLSKIQTYIQPPFRQARGACQVFAKSTLPFPRTKTRKSITSIVATLWEQGQSLSYLGCCIKWFCRQHVAPKESFGAIRFWLHNQLLHQTYSPHVVSIGQIEKVPQRGGSVILFLRQHLSTKAWFPDEISRRPIHSCTLGNDRVGLPVPCACRAHFSSSLPRLAVWKSHWLVVVN